MRPLKLTSRTTRASQQSLPVPPPRPASGLGVAQRPVAAIHLRRAGRRATLTLHILASVGWFGMAALVAFCTVFAGATSDPALAASLYRAVQAAPWLTVPAGLVAIATGVLLGLGTSYGLIRYWWVVAKMAIAVAVVVADAVVIPTAAGHAVTTGHATGLLLGPAIGHVIVLATASTLAVFKPRARTPWGTPKRQHQNP